jgi:hypothetical protein
MAAPRREEPPSPPLPAALPSAGPATDPFVKAEEARVDEWEEGMVAVVEGEVC